MKMTVLEPERTIAASPLPVKSPLPMIPAIIEALNPVEAIRIISHCRIEIRKIEAVMLEIRERHATIRHQIDAELERFRLEIETRERQLLQFFEALRDAHRQTDATRAILHCMFDQLTGRLRDPQCTAEELTLICQTLANQVPALLSLEGETTVRMRLVMEQGNQVLAGMSTPKLAIGG